MSPVLKIMGGLILGAALGAGTYILLTQDNDEGIVSGAKAFFNNVVDQGKLAAKERRSELKIELGQEPAD